MRSCSGPVKLQPLALFLGLMLAQPSARAESTRTHTVYSGQRLGSIAKRYGVSVEAICSVNHMHATDALKPGQRLVIPARGASEPAPRNERESTRANASSSRSTTRHRSATERPEHRTHRVESGQRLESIARRYGVSVAAMRAANDLAIKDVIRPGQVLAVPEPGENLDQARDLLAANNRSFLRAPKRKGHLELLGYNEQFRGTCFDKKGKLLPSAYSSVSRVLAATGNRPRLEPRLVRLLVSISDAFGGRPLRIVSGYRTTSFYQDSRHKLSHAVDLSIPGVPNEVLRDYLRTLPKVGVGYYPNSSFVHFDVREYSAYWVDYAGPGEKPRRSKRRNVTEEPDELHEEEPGEVPVPDAATQREHSHAEEPHGEETAVPGSLPLHMAAPGAPTPSDPAEPKALKNRLPSVSVPEGPSTDGS